VGTGGHDLLGRYQLKPDLRTTERFSEDIDLLVRSPEVDASAGVKGKVLKAIRDTVAERLCLDATQVTPEAATTGVKRNVRYHHSDSTDLDHSAVSSGVPLERGCRGGTFPTKQRQLRSMIAEYAIGRLGESPHTWDEFAPVAVEVSAPTRTLLEARLTPRRCVTFRSRGRRAAAEVGPPRLRRPPAAPSPDVTTELEAIGRDVVQLCADIDEHSRAAAFSFTPRPDDGYGHSPLLDPLHPSWEASNGATTKRWSWCTAPAPASKTTSPPSQPVLHCYDPRRLAQHKRATVRSRSDRSDIGMSQSGTLRWPPRQPYSLQMEEIAYRFEWKLPSGLPSESVPMAEEFVRRGLRSEDLGWCRARLERRHRDPRARPGDAQTHQSRVQRSVGGRKANDEADVLAL
jgi:hypothetical protein